MCEDKLSRIKDCVAIKSEIKPSRTRTALDKHRLQYTYSNLIFILMISHSSCWMEKIKRVDCLWKRWGLYQVYMLPSISCANPFPPSSCLNQAVIWAPKCELATCDPCKSGNNLLHLTTCHDEGEIWGLKKYCIQFHIKPCLLVWLSALALPWSMSRLSRQSPCTGTAAFFAIKSIPHGRRAGQKYFCAVQKYSQQWAGLPAAISNRTKCTRPR